MSPLRRSVAPFALLVLSAAVAPELACFDPSLETAFACDGPSGVERSCIVEGSAEALAVVELVNNRAHSAEDLRDLGQIRVRAVANDIVDRREQRDFVLLQELADVPGVGRVTLRNFLESARELGLLSEPGTAEVIFSPQPSSAAHTVRVERLIREAEHTLDIAMYSFAPHLVEDALQDAVDRGVSIRFIFDEGNHDRGGFKTNALERIGVDVRTVNKDMHHKFMIVDGPRDSLDRAASATVVTGSANWSSNAGTFYDENTLFLRGVPEVTLELQRDFDLMWEHSTDLRGSGVAPFEQVFAAIDIEDSDIPDDPDVDVYLTSENFSIRGENTFTVDTDLFRVGDRWAAAIAEAESSIWIASGHMLHPVIVPALLAKWASSPDLDIRIYLDQQELSSDESELIDDAGIPLRFKTYAARWHYSYAEQMHHKYMIIDGDELLTGSFNLSTASEQQNFENVIHVRGDAWQELIAQFRANFDQLWVTGLGQDGEPPRMPQLIEEIETADPFPVVFAPMALTRSEAIALRGRIFDTCSLGGATLLFSDEANCFTDDFLVCEREPDPAQFHFDSGLSCEQLENPF